jgi:hypothetical protein
MNTTSVHVSRFAAFSSVVFVAADKVDVVMQQAVLCFVVLIGIVQRTNAAGIESNDLQSVDKKYHESLFHFQPDISPELMPTSWSWLWLLLLSNCGPRAVYYVYHIH